jgi:acetylornithine deacetylase/succinyl-diaminopimelate desuccinylase-like protein
LIEATGRISPNLNWPAEEHSPSALSEHVSDKIREEAVRHLQALIRIDTSNPPGNETPAAKYVAGVLADEGIQTRVLEYAPGRGSAVARLRGGGEGPPLLLMAHLDVVPAKDNDWTHPPFAGEVADGYVWGRGAVDTKNATVIQLTALLTLARSRVSLKRDLLLAAMADEEVGGQGAQFLATQHPEWVKAEYALNEGGGEAFIVNGRRIYTFQMAQKGGGNVKMIARGTAGHSSVPYPESAVSTLAAAIVRLKEQPLPHRVVGTTRRFFEGMADAVGDERLAQTLRDVLDPEKQRGAVQQLGLDDYLRRLFDAMMRDVSETTMLKAGHKSNVMPADAQATISARSLPGVSEPEWLQEIRDVVGDSVELHPGRFAPGLEFDLAEDDPLFAAARWAVGRRDSGATLLPFLSCGGTDAMYLAPLGTKVIGFAPMRPDPAGYVLELAHARDERIAVDNLLFGTQVIVDTICRLNGVESPLPLS